MLNIKQQRMYSIPSISSQSSLSLSFTFLEFNLSRPARFGFLCDDDTLELFVDCLALDDEGKFVFEETPAEVKNMSSSSGFIPRAEMAETMQKIYPYKIQQFVYKYYGLELFQKKCGGVTGRNLF